jgi:hypothetical protein
MTFSHTPSRSSLLLRAALLGIVFGLLTVSRADADLWGHLRFGLDLLRDRALSSVDPYSFTQDQPWLNHEWLSELLMGIAWTAAGTPGLILLKATILTAVAVIVWQQLAGASLCARLGIFVIWAIGTIHMTSSIRPQIWTLLAIAILSRTLARDRLHPVRGLPWLFVVWVNCHGGWIVGLGVLGVWAVTDSVARPDRRRHWVLVVTASILATLVNPYGWGLWRFIAETVRVTRDIAEWGPLWGTPVLNWLPWIVTTAAVPWAMRQGRLRWPHTAVLVMLAYGALRVMRIESIYVTASAILLADVIRARFPMKSTPLGAFIAPRQRIVGAVLMCGLVVAGWRSELHSVRCIDVWPASSPDSGVRAALQSAPPGRLVTFFDWGQFALWHFGPSLKVSIDGRRETVYSDRRLREHAAIMRGDPEGLRVLDEWRAEYVWLPNSAQRARAWLTAHGYRLDVETAASFVAVRDDLPKVSFVRETKISHNFCFPG